LADFSTASVTMSVAIASRKVGLGIAGADTFEEVRRLVDEAVF
jgi:hypothetical protein